MQIRSVIAANRFGLGARPGELEAIDRDPQGWLLSQLQGPVPLPAELSELPTSATVLVEVQDIRRMQRDSRRGADGKAAPDIVANYGRIVREKYVAQAIARYRVAAATDKPFFERLVHFWSNHFAVSADKQPLSAIAGLYETEAIRPHVTGKFADLLIAAEQHPAMILYLDNQRSVGPNSRPGQRASRFRPNRTVGLNENLAREILELHTLGVGGGYTQADVTTFAKVITGWSIGGAGAKGRFAEGEPGTFEFREAIHEPGTQRLLGRSYSQRGLGQGEAVLRDLAGHPATARSIATKLARHFVADQPSPSLISALADSYLASGGELSRVYERLIEAEESWLLPLSKYKTPHDFVVSTLRAFDHVPRDARFIVGALDLMGQTPFRPGSPAGWPDTAEEWGGADALYKRIEWASTVARMVGSRTDPVALGEAVLGPALSPETRRAVARAESVVQGTTLLLAAPGFQRR